MKTCAVSTVLLVLLCSGDPTLAQTPKEFFSELRDAGGVHPFARLVCFPAAGQGQDTTFALVAFSKNIASTLRAKGKPVPKEFLDAEKAPEKDQFVLQWAFRNGVPLHKDPEMLDAVVGSKGAMWSADYKPDGKQPSKPWTLRIVLSIAGRYSRDVLVDGNVTTSVYGRCEPID